MGVLIQNGTEGDDMQKIAIFQKKEIRKTLHGGEWWFVLNDVVAVLTDSTNPAQYLTNIRRRDEELSSLFEPVEKGSVQIEPPLFVGFRDIWGQTKPACVAHRGDISFDAIDPE